MALLLLVDGVSPLYETGGGHPPLFRQYAPGGGLQDDLLAAARSADRALKLATPS